MMQIHVTSTPGNILPRALMLAAAGYAVFPLRSNKRPYDNATVAAALGIAEPAAGQGGVKLATRDSAAITRLWSALPDAWVGIACGAASGGLAVLDLDRKDGRDGFATLTAQGLMPPVTAMQNTPSGGRHLLYRSPAGVPVPTDAGAIGEGVDRRGEGGYIVDYGGFHPSAALTVAPDWLLAGASGRTGARQPLGTPELAAHSLTDATRALNAIDPNDLGRDHWISLTSAFKQAAWNCASEAVIRMIWDFWCQRYAKNDPFENNRQWHSITDTTTGWTHLLKHSPAKPEILFGGVPKSTAIAMNSPAIVGEIIQPLQGMLSGKPVSTELAFLTQELPIGFDLLRRQLIKLQQMPWDRPDQCYPAQWSDDDDVFFQSYFHRFEMKPSIDVVRNAARLIAKRREFNPLTDYLESLSWDRRPRLNDMLARYFHAEDVVLAKIVSPKFLIGMVARAYEPGCKRDEVLVLEGPQGIGKSTALNILASDDYFSDSLPNLHDKDAAQHLSGRWLIELGELSALKRSEIEDVKRFLAERVDRYRPPYGRTPIEARRTVVFAATTNAAEYLQDDTGNRRFWPVKLTRPIDLQGLRQDRDQLFAEARDRWRQHEPYHLSPEQEAAFAEARAERREIDPWHQPVAAWLAAQAGPISIGQVFNTSLQVPFEKQNTANNRRLARIMRDLGWERRQIAKKWVYLRR